MLWNRIVRAARLDVQLYEEVEADEQALGQATLVVVLSSLAAGIGSYEMAGLNGLIGGTVAALVSWYAWSLVTYLVGTKLLPETQSEATYGQLLRTIGFASAPGLARIVGVIPGLGIISSFVAGIWMLVAMIIAVRQALDYDSTGRAVGVCVIGWLAQSLVFVAVAMLIGGGLVDDAGSATTDF
ncbi:MAG: YIP1 family protein [bacterium]|nr:YIP1 family protein [bacterium]